MWGLATDRYEFDIAPLDTTDIHLFNDHIVQVLKNILISSEQPKESNGFKRY